MIVVTVDLVLDGKPMDGWHVKSWGGVVENAVEASLYLEITKRSQVVGHLLSYSRKYISITLVPIPLSQLFNFASMYFKK